MSQRRRFQIQLTHRQIELSPKWNSFTALIEMYELCGSEDDLACPGKCTIKSQDAITSYAVDISGDFPIECPGGKMVEDELMKMAML